MTKQQTFKEFTKYCTLNVLGTLGMSVYILADTFFVARDMGSIGLAALNLALPIYGIMRGISYMLGMGGGAKFSILRTQNKEKEANSIFTLTIMWGAFFSLIYMIVGIFFSKSLSIALGANEEAFALTHVYLKTLLISAPIFVFKDIFIFFLRNDKNPKLAMISMLVGSFLNIFFEYIFLFVFDMKMFGAAFAAVLAGAIEILILLSHFFRKKNSFHFTKENLKISTSFKIFAIGFPSFLTEISTSIVFIIFNLVILNLAGNIGVAAYGIVANIFLVVTAVYSGISNGMQPLASKSHAQKDYKSLKRILMYGFSSILGMALVIYLTVFFFGNGLTHMFNPENNPQLQDMAVKGLKIYFISVFFVGFNTILATFFSSIEKTFPAHSISLLRGLIIIIPAIYILVHLYGIVGVWISFPASEFLVSLIAFTLLFLLRKNYSLKDPSILN